MVDTVPLRQEQIMYLKLVFDYRFFNFIASKNRTGGRSLRIFKSIAVLLKSPFVCIPLLVVERTTAFLLVLPIPIYSNAVYLILKHLNGFLGYYLRALYYSIKAKKWGGNIIVEENVTLVNIDNYEFADFVLIDKGAIIAADTLKIGRACHIALNSVISAGGDVVLNDFSCLGINSIIVSATDSFLGGYRACGPMLPDCQRDVKRLTTVIGKDAWIPTNVIVLPGVNIGDGAVLLPNSVVRRNITPWTVWGPEKIVKYGIRETVKFDDPEYE
jgi:galactoside O-acetyltransferase